MFGFKFIYWFVPIGAVLGFIAGLRETSVLATIENLKGNENFIMSFFGAIPQEAFAYIAPVEPLVMNNYPVFVLAVLVLCILNVVRARYFGRVKISYPGGNEFSVPRGTTILEASRLAGIPHVSVCGGKGRCTTCRVKVVSGIEDVSEPNAHEARVIKRLGLDADVRLACQLKPSKNLSVIPLINPETKEIKTRSPVGLSGKEKETVVVFIDLREFTKLSEKKLPYDVVYILNKYYSVCGEIIESNKGRLDKFIGDGIMAIFDGSENSSENCKNSIKTAQMISNAIKDLNIEMKSDFSEELRFGIGIHVGNTIVGMMGYGQTVSETVVGDNVNIAARLEELNKKYGSELVVSKDVLIAANINTNQFTNEKIKIRGRKEELEIYSLEYAHNLEM
jgi:adenylate cyclase